MHAVPRSRICVVLRRCVPITDQGSLGLSLSLKCSSKFRDNLFPRMYIQTYINMQYLNSPIISYYIDILQKLFEGVRARRAD